MSTFHIVLDNIQELDTSFGLAFSASIELEGVPKVPKGTTRCLPYDGSRIVYNHAYKLPAVDGDLRISLKNERSECVSELLYSTKNISRKKRSTRVELIPFGLLTISTQLVAPPPRPPATCEVHLGKMKYLAPPYPTGFLTAYFDKDTCAGSTKPMKPSNDLVDWDTDLKVSYNAEQFFILHLTEKHRIHKDEVVAVGQYDLWTLFDSQDALPRQTLDVTICDTERQVARCQVQLTFSK